MAHFRIPFLSGNQTPRNHTQSPTFAASFPGDTPHVSLAAIMSLAWRIREFTFTGSYSGSVHQTGHLVSNIFSLWSRDYTFSGTVTSTVLTQTAHIPAFSGLSVDEKDVTFANLGWRRDASNVQPDSSGSWSWTGTPSGSGSGSFSQQIAPFINYDNDFDTDPGAAAAPFVPELSASTSKSIPAGPNWNIFSDPAGSSGFFTVDPVIAASFHFPMRLTAGGFVSPGEAQDTSSASGSANFSAVATRFWEYRNRLGQPVFDELTGAQINDPFA